MKAIQINAYGTSDVIEINNNASKPAVAEGKVLVEVYAASINAVDWKIRAGYLKDMAPLPFPATLGGDFAGNITEVGQGVSNLKVGDEVYGTGISLAGGSGAFADFVVTKAENIAQKPKEADSISASALPLVGCSAIQALEEHIKLHDPSSAKATAGKEKILIHGGAGGIGHIAIQLAKAIGAYVATTVSTADVDFVKQLGADEVIDFKTQKFQDLLSDYDAVYDTVGGETTIKSFKVLKKGGILVSMLGLPDQELAKQYGVTAIGQNTKTNSAHLTRLSELVDTGKIKVHVDKVFPIDQAKEAFVYQETMHPKGKVVLKIKE